VITLKNIEIVYKELMNEKIHVNQMQQFRIEMDAKIIKELADEGYAVPEISQALMDHSFALRNKDKEYIDLYLKHQIPKDVAKVPSGLSVSADEAYLQKKSFHSQSLQQFYFKNDFQVVCQLMDQGYSIKEVQKIIMKSSIFAQEIKDPKALATYCDKVMAGINANRMIRSGKIYELAQDVYLKKSAAIQGKYSAKNGYNLFQEGKVIISMLMQFKFFPEVIEEVLRNKSRYSVNADYVKTMMDRCKAVKAAYLQIESADPKNLRSVTDCYRLFAKEYMEKTKTEILNGRDEQKIIQRMFAEKFPRKEIVKAFKDASPVSMEPGRKKDQYISTILAVVEEAYNKKMAYAKENYPLTRALYDEKMENKVQDLRNAQAAYSVDHNRAYYDGIVVRELLEERQYIPNIIKAVMEKSPAAAQADELNLDKTPEGYAKWLIFAAKKVIEMEKAIIGHTVSLQKIPKGLSYNKIREAGFTAQDVYRAAIRERIDTYPSCAGVLNAGYIDKDACEKILTKYPDFPLRDLKDALHYVSPRALMPGVPPEYPALVIHDVLERREMVQKQEDHTKDIQKEYMRQCGLASEGVEVESNMMAYHDGRAALKMLLSDVDVIEVQNAIFSSAQQRQQDRPVEYASAIIEKTKKVKERIQTLKEYIPFNELHKTAKEEYLNRLYDLYQKKNFIQSSMDIAVCAGMMLCGFYSEKEIKTAIQENSPIAVEPGRDDKYQSFIETQAKAQIEQEKIKIKQYRPIPRIEHKENVSEEYEYHVQTYKQYIKLPVTKEVDAMIAGAMLQQGFKDASIIVALAASSVATQFGKDYGIEILCQAKKVLNVGQEQNVGQSLAIGRTKF
jgi:hypothetical protein